MTSPDAIDETVNIELSRLQREAMNKLRWTPLLIEAGEYALADEIASEARAHMRQFNDLYEARPEFTNGRKAA
jgi:hypothetical protein